MVLLFLMCAFIIKIVTTENVQCGSSFVSYYCLCYLIISFISVNSSCLYVITLVIVFFVYRNNYSIILKQPIKGIVYQEVGLPSAKPLSKNQPEI